MGIDIHVRIVKKDRKENVWKQVQIYKKEADEFKIIDIYPFRDSNLFEILDESEDDTYRAYDIITDDLPPALKKEIEEWQADGYGYGFKEINLADLKLYLYEVPLVNSDDDPKAWKSNPVKDFIKRIENYIDFAESGWNYSPDSDIRIIYWFDC